MKKIPWKGIAIGSSILSVLVLLRCYVTASRFRYYGGVYWQGEVMKDPWFYIGMIAAGVCVAALLVMSDISDKHSDEQQEDDGCGN